MGRLSEFLFFFLLIYKTKAKKMYAEKKLELSGVRRGEGREACTKVGRWERVRKTGTE